MNGRVHSVLRWVQSRLRRGHPGDPHPASLGLFLDRSFGFATEWARLADAYSRATLAAPTRTRSPAAGDGTEVGDSTVHPSTMLQPARHHEMDAVIRHEP